MILLDTDTLSLFHAGHAQVTDRVKSTDPTEVIATTVVTRAEILRARFAFLLKADNGGQLQRAQDRLDTSDALLADLPIVKVGAAAVTEFEKLLKQKKLKKIGRADLLIGSIALAEDALLVTRNIKHFKQIPNLRFENWAD
jgi:tRNA(fMet)-specific endonuclease VapC